MATKKKVVKKAAKKAPAKKAAKKAGKKAGGSLEKRVKHLEDQMNELMKQVDPSDVK